MQDNDVSGSLRGLIRQGDVLLVPVDALPDNSVPLPARNGRVVLAEGEATGHAHVVASSGARLYEHTFPRRWSAPARTRYLVLTEPGMLEHDEHDPLPLIDGVYELRRQREYVPSEFRGWASVAD